MILQEEIDRLLAKPGVIGAMVLSRLGNVIFTSFDQEETKAKVKPLRKLIDISVAVFSSTSTSGATKNKNKNYGSGFDTSNDITDGVVGSRAMGPDGAYDVSIGAGNKHRIDVDVGTNFGFSGQHGRAEETKGHVHERGIAEANVDDNDSGNDNDNELQFVCLKSKQYEVLICPSEEFVLVTYQKASKFR